MKVSMPDITQAQVLSAVAWVAAQLAAWGWINNDQGQQIVSASSSFVAFAWIIGDAIIRHGRNKARGAALAAGQPDPALKP